MHNIRNLSANGIGKYIHTYVMYYIYMYVYRCMEGHDSVDSIASMLWAGEERFRIQAEAIHFSLLQNV
jgi:hypothetical protein